MGIWRESLQSPLVHIIDLLSGSILENCAVAWIYLEIEFYRFPYLSILLQYTSNRKILAIITHTPPTFFVWKPHQTSIAIHQKPSHRLQLLIHHGLQQLPVDIEETMLHPNPLRCFMQNKNINESKHPFACQHGLKKLRLVGLVAPILFWLLQSSSTRKHVCWPFCLPNFEELQWQQELLEPPKVKFAQPFRSGGVGKNTTANAMINDYCLCVLKKTLEI